jgi:ectoine hydroxylase
LSASDNRLSSQHLRQYRDQGFLVVEGMFDPDEVSILHAGFVRDCALGGPHVVREADGLRGRSVYASHLRHSEFAALVRLPRLLQPVRQILEAEVYVYQFKVNSKALLLDEVTEFNGPMIYVPGSHRDKLTQQRTAPETTSCDHIDPGDIALTHDQLADLISRWGMTSPKGPAGTVILFHPEIAHSSALNMSPYPRTVLIITYNDVTNVPRPAGPPRPEYLVGRDLSPLEPYDVSLVELAQGAPV